MAAQFGGRWILGIGIVMTSVLTLLTPVAAYVGLWALIAVRVAEGFFEVSQRRNFVIVESIVMINILYSSLI